MRIHAFVSAFVGVAAMSGRASGQRPPPIRPVGPITHVSTEPFSSIASAIRLSDGRVFVNDIVARRVVLFDSTLAVARVITDSASVTATAYGFGAGALIPFHGDTALFLDPQSSSMPVLSPARPHRACHGHAAPEQPPRLDREPLFHSGLRRGG